MDIFIYICICISDTKRDMTCVHACSETRPASMNIFFEQLSHLFSAQFPEVPYPVTRNPNMSHSVWFRSSYVLEAH